MQTIRLVMFDMAGTTVDDTVDGAPLVISAMRRAFAAHGLAVSFEQVNQQRGREKPEMVACLLDEIGGPAELQEPIFEAFHVELIGSLAEVTELAGARQVFEQLHRWDIKIGVGSGFPTDVVEGIIEQLGWARDGLVDFHASAAQVGEGRPSPQMIRVAMEACGIEDPRQVIKVGDTVMDVLEGRNAGVWTVAVLSGTQGRARLEAAGPDALLDSVRELPSWMQAHFA